jgi:hypothetical protein
MLSAVFSSSTFLIHRLLHPGMTDVNAIEKSATLLSYKRAPYKFDSLAQS